jgi:hypothetical protein
MKLIIVGSNRNIKILVLQRLSCCIFRSVSITAALVGFRTLILLDCILSFSSLSRTKIFNKIEKKKNKD